MRKLIAILAVVIVLVGTVFAADPQATLSITATLAAQNPSFKMAITSASTVTGAAEVFSDSEVGATSANSALTDASIQALLADSGTVSIAISLSQVANARLTGTGAAYTLRVEVTDLILQSNGSDVSDNPAAYQKFTVVDDTPSITRASETLTTLVNSNPVQVATLTASNNTLTVSYQGFVAASTNNPVPLGTFSAAWNANKSASAGDYKATVKLFITSGT